MNALEFRLFLFKKQNYSYTFFSSNIPNSISSQDDIYLEVIDENKLVKVYCKDKNILNTCFQSAVSVVSYKPIIVKEIDASLVVGQSAEISSPVAKKLDGTLNSDLVSIPFVQLYTLDCAILDEIFVSKFNVNYHLEISGKGLVFADDCFQITPMTSSQSVNVSSTVTIDDITSIVRALNGTIISQIPTVSCDIDVANVKRINEEYTFKFTSKICPRVNVVRPVTLNQGVIVSDINAMSTLFISFPENIIGNQHDFLDNLQANIVNSSASSVIKLNPNNINELKNLSATVYIPEALYMKFKNPNGKLDLSVNLARPMFLSDLENYKLNYIDHMYDEFYETEYTSLENLSYYIL